MTIGEWIAAGIGFPIAWLLFYWMSMQTMWVFFGRVPTGKKRIFWFVIGPLGPFLAWMISNVAMDRELDKSLEEYNKEHKKS